jgi:hypothetical protein
LHFFGFSRTRLGDEQNPAILQDILSVVGRRVLPLVQGSQEIGIIEFLLGEITKMSVQLNVGHFRIPY